MLPALEVSEKMANTFMVVETCKLSKHEVKDGDRYGRSKGFSIQS
jgi:hypothetical protein